MSILLTLLTFLLFISLSYLWSQRTIRSPAKAPVPSIAAGPGPQWVNERGFDIPKDYSFHAGHTWVLDEGRQNARIGLDGFAANLIGRVDSIQVTHTNRWVRQGQKVWSVTRDGVTVDMVSPVEGIVIAVNEQILRDPNLAVRDPYGEGWILAIHSPDLAINLNNLVRGPLVAAWMQTALEHLREITAPLPTLTALDGGLPVEGLLLELEPAVQETAIHEFFLT